AQEHAIGGKAARPRHDAAAEIDQLVNRRNDGAAMAQVIAEIYEAVAIDEPRRDLVMQAGEALSLAVHRSDSPDPTRTTQAGELALRAAVHPTLPAAAICRRRPVRADQAAASSCSTRRTAVVSSIRSTAANSRTRRSSAA